MSKSYYKNDVYSHDYRRNSRPLCKHTEEAHVLKKGFNPKTFFNQVDSFNTITHTATEDDLHKHLNALKFWLKEAHAHFDDESFTHVSFVRLAHDLSRISFMHTAYQKLILNHLNADKTFIDDLINYSQKHVCNLDPKELCNLLCGFSHLNIKPTETWMDEWFSQTYSYLGNFTTIDFCQSAKALALLKSVPTDEWLEAWYVHCFEKREHFSAVDVACMLSDMGSLDRRIDRTWVRHCLDTLLPVLNILSTETLLGLSRAFFIKEVRGCQAFVEAWFNLSYTLKDDGVHHLTRVFYDLAYAKMDIPVEWMKKWSDKIIHDFSVLTLKDVARILYAFSLAQKDLKDILPIVRKCNDFFAQYRVACDHTLDVTSFRKIIVATSYLKIKGFDLRVDTHVYDEALKALKTSQKIETEQQKAVYDYLTVFIGSDVVKEKFITVIGDRVDLYVPSIRLVIEIDGASHYVNYSYRNEVNALTETKSFILEQSGYLLVRLTNKELSRDFEAYVRRTLEPYIDFDQTLKC